MPSRAYIITSMVDQFIPASSRVPRRSRYQESNRDIVWEGIFEEDLEPCQGCGGLAQFGECLGYAGVHGRDTIVGFTSADDLAALAAR